MAILVRNQVKKQRCHRKQLPEPLTIMEAVRECYCYCGLVNAGSLHSCFNNCQILGKNELSNIDKFSSNLIEADGIN